MSRIVTSISTPGSILCNEIYFFLKLSVVPYTYNTYIEKSLRQEAHKFKASLDHIAGLCLKLIK